MSGESHQPYFGAPCSLPEITEIIFKKFTVESFVVYYSKLFFVENYLQDVFKVNCICSYGKSYLKFQSPCKTGLKNFSKYHLTESHMNRKLKWAPKPKFHLWNGHNMVLKLVFFRIIELTNQYCRVDIKYCWF